MNDIDVDFLENVQEIVIFENMKIVMMLLSQE